VTLCQQIYSRTARFAIAICGIFASVLIRESDKNQKHSRDRKGRKEKRSRVTRIFTDSFLDEGFARTGGSGLAVAEDAACLCGLCESFCILAVKGSDCVA
jgi:hypothetical protein